MPPVKMAGGIFIPIFKKERKRNMENEEFLRLCKAKVAEYTNAHMDKTDRQQIHVNDVYLYKHLKEHDQCGRCSL